MVVGQVVMMAASLVIISALITKGIGWIKNRKNTARPKRTSSKRLSWKDVGLRAFRLILQAPKEIFATLIDFAFRKASAGSLFRGLIITSVGWALIVLPHVPRNFWMSLITISYISLVMFMLFRGMLGMANLRRRRGLLFVEFAFASLIILQYRVQFLDLILQLRKLSFIWVLPMIAIPLIPTCRLMFNLAKSQRTAGRFLTAVALVCTELGYTLLVLGAFNLVHESPRLPAESGMVKSLARLVALGTSHFFTLPSGIESPLNWYGQYLLGWFFTTGVIGYALAYFMPLLVPSTAREEERS